MRARRTLQTATRITATDTPTRRALCSTGGTDNGPGGSPRHQRRRALGGSLGRTMNGGCDAMKSLPNTRPARTRTKADLEAEYNELYKQERRIAFEIERREERLAKLRGSMARLKEQIGGSE